MTILEQIVKDKHQEVALKKAMVPLSYLEH